MALAPFMNRDLFSPAEDFFGGSLLRPFEGAFMGGRELAMPRSMPLDVVEREDHFECKADIPGVNKDDIQVSVDNNVLSIKVDKKQEKEEEKEEGGVKWHRFERSQTFNQRALRMPPTADLDNVSAHYENGVLQLKVPKKQLEEPEKKRINIE